MSRVLIRMILPSQPVICLKLKKEICHHELARCDTSIPKPITVDLEIFVLKIFPLQCSVYTYFIFAHFIFVVPAYQQKYFKISQSTVVD